MVRYVRPHALFGAATDGARGSLSMRSLGLAGQRALQARLARVCRSHRSSSHRRTIGVSPHHTLACTDIGGRVMDCAGSSIAAEWPDRARTVALQPLPGWCAVACTNLGGFGHCEWQSVPVRERREEAKGRVRTNGGTGTSSHSRTTPGTIRAISVNKAGLVSWRLRARRFFGSVTRRRGGLPAHRPSGRGPGCGFASDRAIPPPSQAGDAFV